MLTDDWDAVLTAMPGKRAYGVETRVLYADTDKGGVAYHGSYLRWFEIGRTELLRSGGLIYAALEDRGILCPVVEAACRYLKPALYDDLLTITTWIEQLRRGSITFAYHVQRKTDAGTVAIGKTINAFVNKDLKCIRPPSDVLAALRPLAE